MLFALTITNINQFSMLLYDIYKLKELIMTKVKIVTDSTMDLTEDEIKKYNLNIIPLNSVINGVSYIDGVDISRTKFLERMNMSKGLPK